MKIIYDNIIFSLQKAGGISIYWAELIKKLKNKKEFLFYEFENENIFRKEITICTQTECSLKLQITRYLPFIKKLPSNSIFHSSYYRVVLQKDIVNITTVHDFTYEYFRSGLAKYIHMWQKGFAIKRSDGVICVSENTKKDLIKFYPKIDKLKVKVIYNGVGSEFMKLPNSNEFLKDELKILKDKKYILYIGDRSNYKNFDIAIDIINLKKEYNLVVVGGKEFNNLEKINMKEARNRIYHFRGVDGHKLNVLYNNAFCLLYPSSYEGFGIPIIESMKAGCPVVSTKISSIPEVAGGAGLLVNNIAKNNFLNEISKLENNEFRNEIIHRGIKQSANFSWDKCAEETYTFYKEIWDKKFGK